MSKQEEEDLICPIHLTVSFPFADSLKAASTWSESSDEGSGKSANMQRAEMPTTAFSIGACLAFYASYLLLDVTSLSDSRPSSLAPDSIAGDSFFRSMSSGILALTTSLLLILNEISPANPYPSNSLFWLTEIAYSRTADSIDDIRADSSCSHSCLPFIGRGILIENVWRTHSAVTITKEKVRQTRNILRISKEMVSKSISSSLRPLLYLTSLKGRKQVLLGKEVHFSYA